ncbi:alpha/beta hydrolase [Ramlibacter sp. RBP-2]|uniref:Alpha/beta hydrolase n=1 Tax=Ramlibacter lithotrophicus TaxID=2606681 RepID=A0A7X6I7X7_9BURK|nr:alpha/beta family hydrolase [Ramlibacter lithotrophicus]NKE67883.1 alpha/beta hydrolase [Ramlibacter lithotrophicus]
MEHAVTPLNISLPSGTSVSALLCAPPQASALFVFGHGAGAGMHHPFMADLAAALGERGVATLRYQFPFMEQASKRPDAPAVAQAAVRAAVAEAAARLPDVPLYAGGKSFGGRMTSQAQAAQPLGVRGLVFIGFPLHPAGKPGTQRAEHLAEVQVPMLFLQGTRDALADLALVRATASQLGKRATLHVVEGADHSFHVLVRSGRSDSQVLQELADAMAAWMSS